MPSKLALHVRVASSTVRCSFVHSDQCFRFAQGFDDPNNLLRKAVDQAMGGHPSEKDSDKKVEKIEFVRRLDNPANGRRNEADMFKVANSGNF